MSWLALWPYRTNRTSIKLYIYYSLPLQYPYAPWKYFKQINKKNDCKVHDGYYLHGCSYFGVTWSIWLTQKITKAGKSMGIWHKSCLNNTRWGRGRRSNERGSSTGHMSDTQDNSQKDKQDGSSHALRLANTVFPALGCRTGASFLNLTFGAFLYTHYAGWYPQIIQGRTCVPHSFVFHVSGSLFMSVTPFTIIASVYSFIYSGLFSTKTKFNVRQKTSSTEKLTPANRSLPSYIFNNPTFCFWETYKQSGSA